MKNINTLNMAEDSANKNKNLFKIKREVVDNIKTKINELDKRSKKDQETIKSLQTIMNIIEWKPINL
jgi:hypothetical protein